MSCPSGGRRAVVTQLHSYNRVDRGRAGRRTEVEVERVEKIVRSDLRGENIDENLEVGTW